MVKPRSQPLSTISLWYGNRSDSCFTKSYSIFERLFSINRYYSSLRSLTEHVDHNFSHIHAYQPPKGRRSANKFRKMQICIFADLNNLLDLRTFRNCCTLRICDFWTQSFLRLANLLLQVCNNMLFLLTNIL
jgi:hypothetical protein